MVRADLRGRKTAWQPEHWTLGGGISLNARLNDDGLAELMGRIADGDRAAFEQLYKSTAPRLTAVLRPILRSEADVFDVLQQSYLAIWQKAALFDASRGKALTWMLVLCRNKALDMLRYRARRGISVEVPETLPDLGPASDARLAAALHRKLLLPHLSALSPRIRNAVILAAVYGLTSREIGERTGVSTNTAKSWLRRGYAALRDALGTESLDTLL